MVVLTYHSTDAASTDGGLELAVQFLDGTGCVKALGKQNDSIQEEKWSNAIDDILHQLYSVKEQCHSQASLFFAMDFLKSTWEVVLAWHTAVCCEEMAADGHFLSKILKTQKYWVVNHKQMAGIKLKDVDGCKSTRGDNRWCMSLETLRQKTDYVCGQLKLNSAFGSTPTLNTCAAHSVVVPVLLSRQMDVP